MSPQGLYTLDAARKVLAREECARFGHSYDTIVEAVTNEPRAIFCHRCNKRWHVQAGAEDPAKLTNGEGA